MMAEPQFPKMTDEELKKEMEGWNYEQDHANDNRPDSKLSVPSELRSKRPEFCPPTHAAMSAQALEEKEK